MSHATTDKGDIGIANVTADLIEQGFSILTPVSATSPFDLVVYNGKSYKRVQVKYRTGNILSVALKRNVIHKGKVKKSSKNNEVDVLAIYSPTTKRCYYIKASKFGKTITIRLNETKNGQKLKVNNGKSFLKFPLL